jgi:hypothetical protein
MHTSTEHVQCNKNVEKPSISSHHYTCGCVWVRKSESTVFSDDLWRDVRGFLCEFWEMLLWLLVCGLCSAINIVDTCRLPVMSRAFSIIFSVLDFFLLQVSWYFGKHACQVSRTSRMSCYGGWVPLGKCKPTQFLANSQKEAEHSSKLRIKNRTLLASEEMASRRLFFSDTTFDRPSKQQKCIGRSRLHWSVSKIIWSATHQ